MGNLVPHQAPAEGEFVLPRYPILIPSKGRWQPERALTARWLTQDRVPFTLVVEPSQAENYQRFVAGLNFDGAQVAVLPQDNDPEVGAIPARNWIKTTSTERGDERHWILDDNTYGFYRLYKQKRIPCRAGLALRVCEDFTDRYENVGLSGLNYDMFGVNQRKPFVQNCHVYSCTLVNNLIPYEWRGPRNEDTDLCLQVLAGGWCTILLNCFLVKKKWTMTVKGGMTDVMYDADGRLKMARGLERRWPYVVETRRRFQRPQHVIRDAWRRFDTPLRLKEGVDLSALPKVDEYGMDLVPVQPIKSPRIQRLVDEFQSEHE